MKIWTATLLCKEELQLGEGAYWHPGWDKFLFVDIIGKKVGVINPVNGDVELRILNKMVGFVCHSENENLVVALEDSIEELNFKTGERKLLIEVESEKKENRCNDGICDIAGRLWVGTMNKKAVPNEGALYRFNTVLTKMIDHTSVSNGICWSEDNAIMYYIDSLDYSIKAYDFDAQKGEISNGRIVVKQDNNSNELFDGMCMDNEGMIWVAVWGGGKVVRYNPDNGLLIGVVLVDALNVTSCTFGGYNMQQLFITSANEGLFLVDVGVAGKAPFPFKNN